jgi:hypothetical protein
VALAEVEALAMTAALVGYDPAVSDGAFTFGGTGTLLYGAKIGLEKALPGVRRSGVRTPPVLVCSERAHYACLTVANWLGIGEEQVVLVPTTDDNQMRVDDLRNVCTTSWPAAAGSPALSPRWGRRMRSGWTILPHARTRDELVSEHQLGYVPHVHATVIGYGACSTTTTSSRIPLASGMQVRSLAGTTRRIRHLAPADSIGVDFHKTGFAPYVSSVCCCVTPAISYLTRPEEDTPHLPVGRPHFGDRRNDARGNGRSRRLRPASVQTRGLQAPLGHRQHGRGTREQLEGHAATTVLNGDNSARSRCSRLSDVTRSACPNRSAAIGLPLSVLATTITIGSSS